MALEPFELVGSGVRLEPMSLDHVDGLVAAACENRETYGFTTVPSSHRSMTEFVEGLIASKARGHDIPFARRDATTGRVLGSTRFLASRWFYGRGFPDAVEIGGTWLAASAQHTGVNTEAKLLMLTHAFETWNVQRVDV